MKTKWYKRFFFKVENKQFRQKNNHFTEQLILFSLKFEWNYT